MFEKLVVSAVQPRKHTTAKFFAGTVLLYAIALGCAFVISVVVSDPKLADTGNVLTLIGPPPMSGGTPPKAPPPTHTTRNDGHPDPNHAMTLDQILSHHDNRPPVISFDRQTDGSISSIIEGPPGLGIAPGIPIGNTATEPPPRPDPPPVVKPAAATIVTDNKPVRMTSTVLQGKALERTKPIYPPLAKQIHLQGDVSVEVIISPEGRVESARVVSGHPMFAQWARNAALSWRFQPTFLNGVAVRVTGVIVFVFKLTE